MENLALRHQIGVLSRALGDRRPRFGSRDRALWVVLARRWKAWRYALAIVQPATVVRWHREGFRRFWSRRSRAGRGGRGGRPALDRELVRVDGPQRRHYRLFCVLERDGASVDLGGPSLVLITGMDKSFRTTLSGEDYARVRRLGDEYKRRDPRSVAK
jgi:hypothetical protein